MARQLSQFEAATTRVYVLEDDQFFSSMYRRILSGSNYTVEMAASTDAVDWELLKRSDVLVIGMVMPGMSGTAFLEKLAAQDIDIAIIIATGLPPVALSAALDAIRGLELRIAGILSKPFPAERLLYFLQRIEERYNPASFSHGFISLLQESLDQDGIVINYMPYFDIQSGAVAYIQVDPHLVDEDAGAVNDRDFQFTFGDTTTGVGYYQYLFRKIADEIRYLPVLSGTRLAVSLPLVLVNNPFALARILTLLEAARRSGVEFLIALDDADYFFQAPDQAINLATIKSAGVGLLLDNADRSIRFPKERNLSLFDVLRLDARSFGPANAPDGPVRHAPVLHRLRATGARISCKGLDRKVPQWLLTEAGIDHADRLQNRAPGLVAAGAGKLRSAPR